jgi:hypothetical protein
VFPEEYVLNAGVVLECMRMMLGFERTFGWSKVYGLVWLGVSVQGSALEKKGLVALLGMRSALW